MSSLTIIADPVAEPITLDEAQAHLRVDSEDDADLITALIVAAREYCESAQGRAYVERTYQYITEIASEVELPMPPFIALTSVTARLSERTEQALTSDDYELDTDQTCAVLTIEDYPADTEKLIIVYKAGYGLPDDVPQRIKQAILLLLGYWYEHPESQKNAELPPAVGALLNLDKVNWV